MVNERTHRVIPTTARDDGSENAQPGLREGPPIGRYGRPIAAHPPPPPRALPVPPGRTASASPLGRAATRPSATPRPVAHLATRLTRATSHLATDHRRRAAVAALAASLALAGCAVGGSGTPNPALVAATAAPATPVTATPPPVSPTPSAAAAPGCVDGPWSCPQQQRFAEVTAYTRRTVGAHGYLSVVFTDRVTGATWRTGDTAHPGWTASTVKLAIAADLLRRDRAHQITLSAADRHDLATMLNFSDNAATDRLWKAYGDDAMLARFRSDFGMTGLRFVPGFTPRTYWGFVKCTSDDLAALMRYVLTSADRDYLVAAMRGVAANQQWGVWGAGPAQRPGNKDGWSFESDPYGKHWVTDTVGFAGPAERYTLAIMYQVGPAGSLADGVHAVSDVAALLFGAPAPARVTVPAPDG
jgi:hypothetical protein